MAGNRIENENIKTVRIQDIVDKLASTTAFLDKIIKDGVKELTTPFPHPVFDNILRTYKGNLSVLETFQKNLAEVLSIIKGDEKSPSFDLADFYKTKASNADGVRLFSKIINEATEPEQIRAIVADFAASPESFYQRMGVTPSEIARSIRNSFFKDRLTETEREAVDSYDISDEVLEKFFINAAVFSQSHRSFASQENWAKELREKFPDAYKKAAR